jgi:invasion protein IalB
MIFFQFWSLLEFTVDKEKENYQYNLSTCVPVHCCSLPILKVDVTISLEKNSTVVTFILTETTLI